MNYLGTVWCTRAFLPALEAGRPSHIVNIVSVAGTVAWGPAGPYSASKHAQLAFSRGLAGSWHRAASACTPSTRASSSPETFPQRGVLRNPLLERAVIDPPDVAAAVMRAVDRNRREIFVPRWYRVAAIAQALVPGLMARFSGSGGSRSKPCCPASTGCERLRDLSGPPSRLRVCQDSLPKEGSDVSAR